MPKSKGSVTTETSSKMQFAHLGTDKQCHVMVDDGEGGKRQCRQKTIKGGTVCFYHGGNMQKKAIEKKEKADKIRVFLGDPEITDPFDALLGEVHETAGNVAFYKQLVQDLPIHPTIQISSEPGEEPLKIEKGLYGPDMNGYESPHVLVKMYNEERDRLAKVCKMAIDCGIAERQVRVAERQGEMLVSIIIAVFSDSRIGMSMEKQMVARRVAGELMRRSAIDDT